MSDKKKVLITYTTEEYQELLKQIPKGVPISRYIREKSLEKSVILNNIKTPETSESSISKEDPLIKEIQKRTKEFPLKFTQLNDANARTLLQVEKLHNKFDELINILTPEEENPSGQTNMLEAFFGGRKNKKQ